jgi:hypothetical protein
MRQILIFGANSALLNQPTRVYYARVDMFKWDMFSRFQKETIQYAENMIEAQQLVWGNHIFQQAFSGLLCFKQGRGPRVQ